MALPPLQQLEKILNESKKILILLPASLDGDAIGSGWALYFFLENKGVAADLAVLEDNHETERFKFLPRPKNIIQSVAGIRDFVLSFNTKYNKIQGIKTEELPDEFRVYITPEKGSIDPRDFSFMPAKFKYDALVVLNSPDKESLGKFYEENPDIFFEAPLINIDNHANNENFGQINLISFTSSSTSEALAEIMEKIDTQSVTAPVANCLLAGIISATDSFQSKKAAPKTLQLSAWLMDRGADQQNIIRWLYKTQPLSLLKLWGRIMARLNWDEKNKLAWSLVGIEDFVQSRSVPRDIPEILEKIKNNYSSGEIFFVLYNESPKTVMAVIKSHREKQIEKMRSALGGETRQHALFVRLEGSNLLEAEKEILEKIKAAF